MLQYWEGFMLRTAILMLIMIYYEASVSNDLAPGDGYNHKMILLFIYRVL